MSNLPEISTHVEEFPREKFLGFCKVLKVQTKDFGLVPFELLGTQTYILDEICKGLSEGISTFVCLKARQLGMCYDPSMRVLTADLRWASIDSLQAGDELVAADEDISGGRGRGRKMRRARVEAVKEVFEPAFKITLGNGAQLIATQHHRHLCQRRGGTEAIWRMVSDTKKGDHIRYITAPPWGGADYEDGWMGGLIDGEGSLATRIRAGANLSISQVQGSVLERARAYLIAKGYHFREEIDRRKPGTSSKFGSKDVHKLVLSRMGEIFRLLGQCRPSRFMARDWWSGKALPGRAGVDGWAKVIKIEALGRRRMIDLQTSTKTFVCEGIVSHNSTFFLALDMFWAFEYKGLAGTFATHEEGSRDDFRNTIEVFFAELPKTHKVRYARHNRSMLILKNGSKFRYIVFGTKEKKSNSVGRSGASNFLHATEVAFYGSEDDIKSLRSSLSSHYPHRLAIFESTANGFNHFFEMCDRAKESPTQRFIFVGWWRNELFAYPRSHPFFLLYCPEGENTRLTERERKGARAVKEQFGFTITLEQIAWYRWKLDDEFNGDQLMMNQEFPWVEEDAFVATGSKFFDGERLTDAMREAKKKLLLPYRYTMSNQWADTRVVQAKDARQATLKIWEESSPHGTYVIGCDPAFGSSESADRSVIHVARCFADRIRQVAEFVSPVVSTYQCAWVLAHLAGYYKNCMVNIEITGGSGLAVFQELNNLRADAAAVRAAKQGEEDNAGLRNCLGLMKHYLYRRADAVGGSALAFQMKMNQDLKVAMLNGFKDDFELGRVALASMGLLEEMKSIVQDGGQIEAEGRKKDDRVMAAALAHWAYKQWLLGKLKGEGLTEVRAVEIEKNGGRRPLDLVALNYLKRQKITVPAVNT